MLLPAFSHLNHGIPPITAGDGARPDVHPQKNRPHAARPMSARRLVPFLPVLSDVDRDYLT